MKDDSSFSSDDQLWTNVCRHLHLFSFLHSVIREINWNREKINKLNEEGWCNYVRTIHHCLTRLMLSEDEWLIEAHQLRSASIRLIIFTSTLHSAQADHPSWTSWPSSCGRTFNLSVFGCRAKGPGFKHGCRLDF